MPHEASQRNAGFVILTEILNARQAKTFVKRLPRDAHHVTGLAGPTEPGGVPLGKKASGPPPA